VTHFESNDDYNALKHLSILKATNLQQQTKVISAYLGILCTFAVVLSSLKPELYKSLFSNQYNVQVATSQYLSGKLNRLNGILGEMAQGKALPVVDRLNIGDDDFLYFPPDVSLEPNLPTFHANGSLTVERAINLLGIKLPDDVETLSRDQVNALIQPVSRAENDKYQRLEDLRRRRQAFIDRCANAIWVTAAGLAIVLGGIYMLVALWSKRIEHLIDWIDSKLAKRRYYQQLFRILFPEALLGSFKEPDLVHQLTSRKLTMRRLRERVPEDADALAHLIYRYLKPDGFVALFVARGEAAEFLKRDEYEEDGELIEEYQFNFSKRA
jgi:hypothetical protein